jgi:hypothetical protein
VTHGFTRDVIDGFAFRLGVRSVIDEIFSSGKSNDDLQDHPSMECRHRIAIKCKHIKFAVE